MHGIKMELIPRGAHHRLGILERNHTVRRKMLETFKAEMPDCSFEKAFAGHCTPAQQAELSQGRYARHFGSWVRAFRGWCHG